MRPAGGLREPLGAVRKRMSLRPCPGPRRSAHRGRDRARSAVGAITAVLAWSVWSFGAVYDWAQIPLAIVVGVFGALYLRLAAFRVAKVPAAAFGVLLLAIASQLVPLTRDLVNATTPSTAAMLSLLNVRFAHASHATHAISTAPAETVRGLAFVFGAAVWTMACAVVLSRPRRPAVLAWHLVVAGTAVGITGLAQEAFFNGKLLWFWEPTFHARNAFGPFVNRNHFAGWMLLALAISVGYLFGQVRAARPQARGWRERFLWLDSGAATPIVLTGAAIVVMACSILWTMSRSGIAGAGVAMTIMIAAAIYRSKERAHGLVLAASLATVVLTVVAWRGADVLVDWYGNTSTLEWRFALWQDTLPALRDFWLTGSGLNTYGTVMLVYPRTDMSVFPREAHNDYLQLAVEGGLLVGIPVLLLIGAVAREAIRRLRQPQDEMTWWIRMGAVAGICGMAVQELTEFSLQIPGVALLFATCVAMAIHEPAPIVSPTPSRRRRRAPELVTSI
jgi:O-antigen ligase